MLILGAMIFMLIMVGVVIFKIIEGLTTGDFSDVVGITYFIGVIRERSHDVEQKLGQGRGFGGECEIFFDKLHTHTFAGERSDQAPQIHEITGKAIHRMHDHGVTVAHVGDHLREFGPVDILSGCRIGKGAIKLNADQLPVDFLVKRTDPDVTDLLSRQLSTLSLCDRNSESLRLTCQQKPI